MMAVLAFATVPPNPTGLRDRVDELTGADATVLLACWFDVPSSLLDIGIADVHRIVPAGTLSAPGPGRRRGGLPRWLTRGRQPATGTVAAPADRVTQRWLEARLDDWVNDGVAESDYLVALDSDAVYPVWEFARATPGVRASFGLYAVTSQLAGRSELSDGR